LFYKFWFKIKNWYHPWRNVLSIILKFCILVNNWSNFGREYSLCCGKFNYL